MTYMNIHNRYKNANSQKIHNMYSSKTTSVQNFFFTKQIYSKISNINVL